MNKKGDGQMNFVISLICIGLFTVAIIGYVINFANDNNSYIDISDDSQLNTAYSQAQGNLTQFQSESSSTTSSILNSTISPGSTTTVGAGQYAITSGSTLGTAKNIIFIGYQKIFGSGNGFSIFINTFFAILGIIAILFVIKLWRSGLPD